MLKITLIALLVTPSPKYLELSDGYAVRTSDINAIVRTFCANPNAIRSERWQSIQPQVAKLILPQIERRVRLELAGKLTEAKSTQLNRQDQLKVGDAIWLATEKLCP